MEPTVDDQPHEIVARFDSTFLANVVASRYRSERICGSLGP